jgi:hypothetical protein
MSDEIEFGPFFFGYDEKHNEMYVNTEFEHIGTVNSVWPEMWKEFVGRVQTAKLNHQALVRIGEMNPQLFDKEGYPGNDHDEG